MREIMLAELRRQEFQAEAARFRLAQELCNSGRNGLNHVEAMRRSLSTQFARAKDVLNAIDWVLFTMGRDTSPL